MDNSQKKQLKQLLIIPVLAGFAIAAIPFLGYEFPFFNRYNPLYTPYFWLFLAVIIFAVRSRIKDNVKTIWNTLAFFNSAGLTRVFDVNGEDIHPIYLDYTDSDGIRRQIKHSHPIVIPSEDGFEQVYLVPETGLEAINPEKIIKKYGVKLSQEQVSVLKSIPEAETQALNPELLVKDMTETEDADTIFQEFKEHLASISAWGKVKSTLRENWFILVMSGVAGFAIASTVFMITGADFRGVIGH
jgi:hypothetical protein